MALRQLSEAEITAQKLRDLADELYLQAAALEDAYAPPPVPKNERDLTIKFNFHSTKNKSNKNKSK